MLFRQFVGWVNESRSYALRILSQFKQFKERSKLYAVYVETRVVVMVTE